MVIVYWIREDCQIYSVLVLCTALCPVISTLVRAVISDDLGLVDLD